MTDTGKYGSALFKLAEECGVTDEVLADIHTLRAVLNSEPSYTRLLDTPTLKKAERTALVGEAIGSLNLYLVNTVKLLAEKRLAYTLPTVLDVFVDEYDASRGIERIEAISAVALSGEQLARLTERLEKITGKTVIIRNTVDADILGGIKLRYCGVQLDGSVKTRLDSLEKKLKNILI
ncbi:MAG: ATP synthase F1 subunit delta [Clostridia bacterium]|nr:ATP synthase F1 subunit delta [Clostridia bacterium]